MLLEVQEAVHHRKLLIEPIGIEMAVQQRADAVMRNF